MKQCKCGGTQFYAHQQCYHDIVVDSNNIFHRNIEIYESETPYGPYSCTQCGAEYSELNELEAVNTDIGEGYTSKQGTTV